MSKFKILLACLLMLTVGSNTQAGIKDYAQGYYNDAKSGCNYTIYIAQLEVIIKQLEKVQQKINALENAGASYNQTNIPFLKKYLALKAKELELISNKVELCEKISKENNYLEERGWLNN